MAWGGDRGRRVGVGARRGAVCRRVSERRTGVEGRGLDKVNWESAGSAFAAVVMGVLLLGAPWDAFAREAAAEPEAGRPPRESAQEQDDAEAQIEELARVLGMTASEIEALGLSAEEMRRLLDGVTEETVVVGSRAQPRTVTASPVPVDVLSTTDITRQGAVNLQDQLRTVIPSFNVNTQPISDASTVVRPAMLRNLAPDHTLVLVNGKRRHRSSIIDWHGGNGVAFGSQGPDISAIPAIALRQVEVLRDGAAAQYGSDAIAGVMNFQLKDANSGGALEFDTGAFGAGDGEAFNVAGNVGLPLGATGFALRGAPMATHGEPGVRAILALAERALCCSSSVADSENLHSHRHRGREPVRERCRRDDGTARRSTASVAGTGADDDRPAAVDPLTAPRVVTLGQIPVVVARSATALRARPQTDVHFAWSSAA